MSLTIKKGFRIFLWVMLVWILARGIYSFFNTGQNTQAAPVEIPEPAIVEVDAAKAFAASFARDYFTFTVDNPDERARRLEGFLSRALDKYAGLEVIPGQTFNQYSQQAWPWSVKKIDDFHAIITVKTKVATAGKPEKYVYLAVPVAASNDGNYQVYDLPSIVAGPKVPELQKKELEGERLEPAEEKAVTDMLNGFFKAYTQGQPAEISYYFTDAAKAVSGLNSTMYFKELRDIRVIKITQSNDVKTELTLVVQDPLSNAIHKNRYILDLVKDGDRWYIENMQP